MVGNCFRTCRNPHKRAEVRNIDPETVPSIRVGPGPAPTVVSWDAGSIPAACTNKGTLFSVGEKSGQFRVARHDRPEVEDRDVTMEPAVQLGVELDAWPPHRMWP